MNNCVLKLMVFTLGLLPFLAGSMERPLAGQVQYELSLNNKSGEQPLNLQVNDANGRNLLQQQVNLDQWSTPIFFQLNQLPINVNISSANGVISGGTQLTQQKIRDELQKNGIIIPYNFSGKVVVTIVIYQRAVIYHGGLIPALINTKEPQTTYAVFQPVQTVPAAAQISLPRGEYNITVFGANKKPVRIQFLTFDQQAGNYSSPIEEFLESNGTIKQSFSANDFPILFRVLEGANGNTLVFEDDLDLAALNLKDFSYTVSDTLGKFGVSYYPQVSHGKEAQALRQRVHAREAVAQPSYSPAQYCSSQAPVASIASSSERVQGRNFQVKIRHESRKQIKIALLAQDGTRLIERILQPNDSFILPDVSPQAFPLRVTLVDDQGKSIKSGKIRIPSAGIQNISIMTYDGWVFVDLQVK
jgi:hypothetical protein